MEIEAIKKSRFTEQQIESAFRLAERGTAVREIFRKTGVSERTFYRWKKKPVRVGAAQIRRLELLFADPSLDKHIQQDALNEKL